MAIRESNPNIHGELVLDADILERLKAAGWSSTRIHNLKMLSDQTVQNIRAGNGQISWNSIHAICYMLNCQPDSFITYKNDDCE